MVKDIICSNAFVQSFTLDLRNMASSSGAEEKNVDDAAHVAADKGESRHS